MTVENRFMGNETPKRQQLSITINTVLTIAKQTVEHTECGKFISPVYFRNHFLHTSSADTLSTIMLYQLVPFNASHVHRRMLAIFKPHLNKQ